jgi:transcriptional regulator with XRE-family HTH domain
VSEVPRQPPRRRRLGRSIRKLREKAGYTQADVAAKLECTLSKVSRYELGQLPEAAALREMLDMFGLLYDESEQYVEKWRDAKKRRWYQDYNLNDQGYVGLEDEADVLREFHPLLIPGIFQTEDCARDVFSQTDVPHSDAWVDKHVKVRMKRQERLHAEDPLIVRSIIDESVLYAEMPPKVKRDQIRHLAKVAKLPNVTIQILPKNSGNHAGKYGPFIVLSFPDPDEADVAYLEHALGAAEVVDQAAVKAVKLRFDHLASLALNPEQSLVMLDRLAATL